MKTFKLLSLSLITLSAGIANAEVKYPGSILESKCAVSSNNLTSDNTSVCLAYSTATKSNKQGSVYLVIKHFAQPTIFVRATKTKTMNAVGANTDTYTGNGVASEGRYPIEKLYSLKMSTSVGPNSATRGILKIDGVDVLNNLVFSTIAHTESVEPRL
jgi:hypothetical protein